MVAVFSNFIRRKLIRDLRRALGRFLAFQQFHFYFEGHLVHVQLIAVVTILWLCFILVEGELPIAQVALG